MKKNIKLLIIITSLYVTSCNDRSSNDNNSNESNNLSEKPYRKIEEQSVCNIEVSSSEERFVLKEVL